MSSDAFILLYVGAEVVWLYALVQGVWWLAGA